MGRPPHGGVALVIGRASRESDEAKESDVWLELASSSDLGFDGKVVSSGSMSFFPPYAQTIVIDVETSVSERGSI